MKTEDSREQVLELLRNRIVMGGDKKLISSIQKDLIKEGKYTKDYFTKVWTNVIPLEVLPVEELVWLIQAIENYNRKICSVDDFFEQHEINSAISYRFIDEDSIDKYLKLTNVTQLAEHQYMCYASVKQIGMLMRSNTIIAVPDVQRESKVIKVGNETIRMVRIEKNRVKAIAKKIIDGEYYYNAIRINIGSDGFNYLTVDEDNTITLDKNNPNLNIIPDGNHRCNACQLVLTQDPSHDYEDVYFPLLITNLETRLVNKITEQEWNFAKVNVHHQKAMATKTENEITNYIIKNGDKSYTSKIVATKQEIRDKTGFIRTDTLVDSIAYSFDMKDYVNSYNKSKLAKGIIEFLDCISAILENDIKNYTTSKNNTTRTFVWGGFVYLYSKIYNKSKEEQFEIAEQFIEIADLNNRDFEFSATATDMVNMKKVYAVVDEVLKGIGVN